MASEKYVQVPADSVGQKIRTIESIIGTDTVSQQVVSIADAVTPANLASISAGGAVKVDGSAVTQPVSGTFYPATQPVSIASMPSTPVTGTFWQTTQPISGTVGVSGTLPVSGTFWQVTQPVSGPLTDTQLRASAVPVSGTFWQSTQPVSIASMPSTPVTGTFWQATQPISGNVGVSVAGAASSTPIGAVSLGNNLGKTNVLKTGSLTTSAATADQVVLTYTVTAGKVFYLNYLLMQARLTTLSATASVMGTWSLETPSGTKVLTIDETNATTSHDVPYMVCFPEPIPIAAGVVVRIVVTPAAATSMKWQGNIGGYEK